MDKMVGSRGSPAQIIQHSDDVRSMFRMMLSEAAVRVGQKAPKERNLRAAKHRFESYQRPLGRTVRLFPTIVRLMVHLYQAKRDQRARDWLAFVAASPQHNVQLAMLADAADEGMSLTRFCDSESMDVASLSSRISCFLDRVSNLFGPSRACLSSPGYTKLMIETLKHPITWMVGDRAQGTRQPTAADLDACFGRMQAFLKLAKAELEAEFPDWELAQSFRVFEIGKQPLATDAVDAKCQQHHLDRLAHAFDVDPIQLAIEFAEHMHLARQAKHQTQCTSKEAWIDAVDRNDKRNAVARLLMCLKKVPGRWICFVASTSGDHPEFRHHHHHHQQQPGHR